MARLLSNLKEISIEDCDGIEEVVSNRDDDDDYEMATHHILFPCLQSLFLEKLKSLRDIGGGASKSSNNNAITTTFFNRHDFKPQHDQGDVTLWSLCQYPKEIWIAECNALSIAIPSHAAYHMQNLQELSIWDCESMTHIFTFGTLESLKQLKSLEVKDCRNIQVIVKEEEDGDHTALPSSNNKVAVFLCLKSLILKNLPSLNGFFLAMNYEFQWPSLDEVEIVDCPNMTRFTHGDHSTSPMLKYISTKYGKHSLELESCGLNFHQETTSQGSTSSSPVLEMIHPCSFSNLEEIDFQFMNDGRKYIIPSIHLHQLQNLEKINLEGCHDVEEIFEGLNELQYVVKLPKLIQLHLEDLHSLKHIWKSNRWTVVEFPCLTTISIDYCDELTHVFSDSMVGSLSQLQELRIHNCSKIEVIIKEEGEEGGGVTTRVADFVEFPSLKSLTLEGLDSTKGFCLGRKDFQFPSLETLDITSCPELMVFTNGLSNTPKLKLIRTTLGLCDSSEDFNTFVRTRKQEGFEF